MLMPKESRKEQVETLVSASKSIDLNEKKAKANNKLNNQRTEQTADLATASILNTY